MVGRETLPQGLALVKQSESPSLFMLTSIAFGRDNVAVLSNENYVPTIHFISAPMVDEGAFIPGQSVCVHGKKALQEVRDAIDALLKHPMSTYPSTTSP